MALERVLLAVEPDDWDSLDGLVDTVVDVAGPAGATVYLLYVFPRDEYDDLLDQMGVDQTSGGLSPDEVAERHESVRVPADRFEERGIDFEIRGVAGGQPSDQIVRKVEEFDADIAVISGTKRSPAGKAMFGDHAQQVLLNAPVPVLYVKKE